MRPRPYTDLLAFLRAACTHTSRTGDELPALPFYVKENVVGWVRPSFADLLRRWPHIFEVANAFVALRAAPDTPEARSEVMAQVAAALRHEGIVRGWRDELVSIATHHGAPELFRMERAATRHFGFMAHAVHANGFVRRDGLAHVWISRRSTTKPVDPSKLDNLVGGRISAGMGVDETLRKEAWEEGGIAPALLAGLNCIGALRTEYSVPDGLHRETMFVYDLWLPPDFTPANQDGEVAEIRCLSMEEVVQEILAGEFTLDAGTVMIDGLLRQGAVMPEDPQYLHLLRLMKP